VSVSVSKVVSSEDIYHKGVGVGVGVGAGAGAGAGVGVGAVH